METFATTGFSSGGRMKSNTDFVDGNNGEVRWIANGFDVIASC